MVANFIPPKCTQPLFTITFHNPLRIYHSQRRSFVRQSRLTYSIDLHTSISPSQANQSQCWNHELFEIERIKWMYHRICLPIRACSHTAKTTLYSRSGNQSYKVRLCEIHFQIKASSYGRIDVAGSLSYKY